MKKIYFFLSGIFILCTHVINAQTVGIGTTSPNAKAILEIKATDKGVLFPRLNSAQRNAIANPPNGLHIYNTDERCLNYYDSTFQTWNCYCTDDTCNILTIRITASICNIDFYNAFAVNYPGKTKFSIIINAGVNVYSCNPALGAINFSTLPNPASINIINYGNIYGAGGTGSGGASGEVGSCSLPAFSGVAGGHAIITSAGSLVTVSNYGIIAGGGGGGGGGGRNVSGEYGGGVGGGAGMNAGFGGQGGGITSSAPPIIPCYTSTVIAQNGNPGTLSAGGIGGTGASGGGNGGNGGGLALAGTNGTGAAAGLGGIGGKAISGGSGNIINNLGGGQSFGIVD